MENFRKFIAFTALATFVLIVLGGAIRVFDAGMSCPDWPKCYGQFIPFPEPEAGYWLGDRHYVWWEVALEWTHRLLAATIGFLMLGVLAWSVALRKISKKPFHFTLISLFLLATQVKMGAITVWLGNIHWSVAAHLGNALLFWASLIVLRRVTYEKTAENAIEVSWKAKLALKMFALSVFITILIGGMVSSSYAGGVCGGLFNCQGTWFPEDFTQFIHMKHRYMVLLTLIIFAIFYVLARKEHARLKKSALGLKIILIGQLCLGILTLYSFAHYPVFYRLLSVAHLAVGSLLWMACVGTLCNVYLGLSGNFHDRKR